MEALGSCGVNETVVINQGLLEMTVNKILGGVPGGMGSALLHSLTLERCV